MSISYHLSTTFLGHLNLNMSNPSSPPFADNDDYINPPSTSVSYTLPMTSTPISSRLASPPTPRRAPQTVPDPYILLPFNHFLSYPSSVAGKGANKRATTASYIPSTAKIHVEVHHLLLQFSTLALELLCNHLELGPTMTVRGATFVLKHATTLDNPCIWSFIPTIWPSTLRWSRSFSFWQNIDPERPSDIDGDLDRKQLRD